jgi:Domain of unknown function (DUF4037)
LNGLEVARRFFAEWGLPFLQEHFPELVKRTAAGLFRGSQVLGADDVLSRDHGWGPMFLLLLTQEDYVAQGQAVEQAMVKAAPQEWLGYRYGGGLTANIEVSSVDRYLEHWLGFARPPTQWQQWLGGTPSGVREYELYLIRHGQVFSDPLGEFSARRVALAQYPRLAWLQRVSDELFKVWHYGQYNFLDRLLIRQDPLAVQMAQGHFIEASMRLCLLLERDYTPHWKWLAFAFNKCPGAALLDHPLRQLSQSSDLKKRGELVREVCAVIHEMLEAAGLASQDLSVHPHPLFCDHGALRQRIAHEQTITSE